MSADHASPTLPDEPKTPMWLPALGAALFFSVGVWWLATSSSPPPAPADTAAAADAGAADAALAH